MITNKQIKQFAANLKDVAIKQGDAPLFAGGIEEGVLVGVVWAVKQLDPLFSDQAALVEQLQSENARLREAIEEAITERDFSDAIAGLKNALK